MTKVSILVTTYNRDHLLKWNLYRLAKVTCSIPFEVLILNEGPEEKGILALAEEYKDKIDIRYFHTFLTKQDPNRWRVPGFALNIGARQATGDILIISCAEMFLMDTNLDVLLAPFNSIPGYILCTTQGKDDNGTCLAQLKKTDDLKLELYNSMIALNTKLPFFMACYKEHYFEIKGYDEDFTGTGWDDDDFVTRMLATGENKMVPTDFKVLHLWHERKYNATFHQDCQKNATLYSRKRSSQIWIRNQGIDWGKWEIKDV